MDKQEIIDSYIALTGVNIAKALTNLENSNWDLQLALNIQQNTTQSPTNLPSSITEIRRPDETQTMQLIDNSINIEEIPISDHISPEYFYQNKPLRELKILGKQGNKNLLIYVYDNSLNCTHLTNDLWKFDFIQDLLESKFICGEYSNTSLIGKEIVKNYNITQYPYIAILDYETGSQLNVLSKWRDKNDFMCEVCGFLEPKDILESEPEILNIFHPPKDDKNGYNICFSLKDKNLKFVKRFLKSESLTILYQYIKKEYNLEKFQLLTSYPRKNLYDMQEKTLEDLSLNNIVVIVDTNIV